jgi:hypothetical protein
MRAPRTIATAGLLAFTFCAGQLLAPSGASAKACITELVGNVCLAQCIGNLQQDCGSDLACHQAVAAGLQALGNTPAGSEDCEDAISAALMACDCD